MSNSYPRTLVNRLINVHKKKRVKSTEPPPIPPPTGLTPPTLPPSPPTTQVPDRSSIEQHLPSRPSASAPPPSRPSASNQPTNASSTNQPPRTTTCTNLPSTNIHPDVQHSNGLPTGLTDNIPHSNSNASNSHPTTIAPALNTTRNLQLTTSQPDTIYKSLPYIPGLTERITKLLKKEYPQVTIAPKQYNTVKGFHTKVKDPKNHKDKNNIIYNIPCNNCPSSYIGMTRNKLSQRLSGHQSHVNKLDTLLNTSNNESHINDLKLKTAMIEHCITHEHRFNFDKTRIVDHSNNTQTLSFLEMCHIYNTPNTVNRREDVDNLNTAYAAILHTLNTKTIYAQQDMPTMPTES